MKREKPLNKKRGNRAQPESYRVYEMDRYEKNKFLLLCGLCLMFIFYIFYHNMILSLLISGLAYPCMLPYSAYLAEKRRRELKDQFRDLLYSISASVSAGRQMPEALEEAEQNMKLIYQENALIVLELADMVKRLREYREPEEEILRNFAARASSEDIYDFVDIYLICRETGGDLIRVISKASDIIMDKIAIEREILTITAQKRFEARILTAIPFLIIFFLQAASPDYLAPMYNSLQGRILMTMALLGIASSYVISLKLTKIEV